MNFRCETQGEQAFQQIIGQKLIGLHLPPQQTIVSLMKELLLDLRILREEKQVSLASLISRSRHNLNTCLKVRLSWWPMTQAIQVQGRHSHTSLFCGLNSLLQGVFTRKNLYCNLSKNYADHYWATADRSGLYLNILTFFLDAEPDAAKAPTVPRHATSSR